MANSQLLALACLAVLAASAVAAPAAGCTTSKFAHWKLRFQQLSYGWMLATGCCAGVISCSKAGDTFAQRGAAAACHIHRPIVVFDYL
jgi:hypothetical protein